VFPILPSCFGKKQLCLLAFCKQSRYEAMNSLAKRRIEFNWGTSRNRLQHNFFKFLQGDFHIRNVAMAVV
jgi:hypothetical protein